MEGCRLSRETLGNEIAGCSCTAGFWHLVVWWSVARWPSRGWGKTIQPRWERTWRSISACGLKSSTSGKVGTMVFYALYAIRWNSPCTSSNAFILQWTPDETGGGSFLAGRFLGKGSTIHSLPALFFFWRKFVHTNSTLFARIGPQWLSELRQLWPCVPCQVVF